MSKFKKHDTVIVTNLDREDIEAIHLGLRNGLKGTVVGADTGGLRPVMVKLETGECYGFAEDELELPASNINKPIEFEGGMYNPLTVQQSGDHYRSKGIQPIEYGIANNLSFPQVNIVKYITRHEDKNGIDDLAKSIHYHFFEALRAYGEEGSTELRDKVLKLLNKGN